MGRSKEVAVLNIGSHYVSVAVGVKLNERMFGIRGMGQATYLGYDEESWYDGSEIESAIRMAYLQAERKAGVKISKLGTLYVGLPSMFCQVRETEVVVEFSKKRKITSSDVSSVINRANPFRSEMDYIVIEKSISYFYLDNVEKIKLMEPVGLEARNMTARVAVVAAERRVLDFFNEIFARIGIKDFKYTNSVFAEANYLYSPETRDNRVLFVDLGYLATTVAFARGDGVQHMVTIPMGGAHIISDVSYYFGIDYDLAEEVYGKLDLAWGAQPMDTYGVDTDLGLLELPMIKVNEVAAARIEEIALYVKHCIQTSPYKYPSHLPLGLTGSGIANIRGAKELLSRKVGKSVDVEVPSAPGYEKAEYSQIASLVDYAIRRKK